MNVNKRAITSTNEEYGLPNSSTPKKMMGTKIEVVGGVVGMVPRKSELITESAIQASLRKQNTTYDQWSNRPASTRLGRPRIQEYDAAFGGEGAGANTFSPLPHMEDKGENAVQALKNEMSSLRDQLDDARQEAAALRVQREADVEAAKADMRRHLEEEQAEKQRSLLEHYD